MKTIILVVLITVVSGFILEEKSEEFQFGMKTRYVEQCMTPMQAFGASMILLGDGMKLYNVKKADLFLGTTKEQQEKLQLFTDAGYYWIYLNSCNSLKNKNTIKNFLAQVSKN